MLGEMSPRDLPDVLEIERASFPHPWSSALFLQELRVPFSRIIVIRPPTDATVVGYLCRWFVADEIHVLNVAVHPLHRRRGIGALLMDEALREARERGTEAITLEVRRSNAAARRMYDALGFDEVGVRRDYYGAGEDALIMRLVLADG
jgi:[ribosomal protein S18]-alanine N-acetyltransferase